MCIVGNRDFSLFWEEVHRALIADSPPINGNRSTARSAFDRLGGCGCIREKDCHEAPRFSLFLKPYPTRSSDHLSTFSRCSWKQAQTTRSGILFVLAPQFAMDYGLGDGFEPMHVDRKSLYTSLEKRIKYLHSFLDWNSGKHPSTQPPLDECSHHHQPMSRPSPAEPST